MVTVMGSHETQPEPAQEDELFVDFANTLEFTRGEPEEQLGDANALLGWLHGAGLLSNRARATEAGRLRRDTSEADRCL
jgi:hypothetical protein